MSAQGESGMSDPVAIHDRFIEVPASTPLEREREEQGWTCIRDRATGKIILIGANSRRGALWIIKALNAADRSEDRFVDEDAA